MGWILGRMSSVKGSTIKPASGGWAIGGTLALGEMGRLLVKGWGLTTKLPENVRLCLLLSNCADVGTI